MLVSPGVNVTVTDESAFAGSGPGTVPFILLATEQDKLNSAGDGIAQGTTQANAGKLRLITSQRELLQDYGVPNFNNVGGSSQHGNELNEHGLLAAYSYLGAANRAYVMRADIDLGQLQPLDSAPTGDPAVGSYWLKTDTTNWGIYTYNTATTMFDPVVPTVYFLDSDVDANAVPLATGTTHGEFAVVAGRKENASLPPVNGNPGTSENRYFRWEDGVVTGTGIDQWVEANEFGTVIVDSVYPTTAGGYTLDADTAWINRSEAELDFRVYTSNGWTSVQVPIFVEPSNAIAFYGSELGPDSFYAGPSVVSNNLATDGPEIDILQWDIASNAWLNIPYVAQSTEPTGALTAGTLWFSNEILIDIMVNSGTGSWEELSATLSIQPSEPSAPSNGDIWVATDQIEDYPVIYRRVNSAWTQINNSDQTTPNGIIFADARPEPTFGTDSGVNNGGGTAPDLDADRPDPLLYPAGMLLWNTRYSSLNVKEWATGYTFEGTLIGDRWISVSGLAQDGSLLSGRKAQRQLVVEALAQAVTVSDELRAESVFFNIMATPGYPELIDEMIALNVDRREQAFIIGDTPLRLDASGTSLQRWATNANGAAQNGEEGLISADPYVGVYYPSALTTNLDGEAVVQPASHIILRTLAFNDQVAYPWFAPAGLNRGRVNNAVSVGYINSESEYVPVELNPGQRDTLYVNNINPIALIPGQGLIVYGQKTRNPFESSLDRVNVARLVNYIRYQADLLARPFLFEPNDELTRDNARDAFDRFLAELVTLRGVFDYLVVVDESNNTPTRIDRNELWIDIAIQPAKAIEFINIPIRLVNTGAF